MNTATPAKPPYLCGNKLHAARSEEEQLDKKRYLVAKEVRILRYLVDSTQADLTYVVGVLVRHVSKPTIRHWHPLKKITRYIQNIINDGLLYRPGNNILHAQRDAEFVGSEDSRQFTSKSTNIATYTLSTCHLET